MTTQADRVGAISGTPLTPEDIGNSVKVFTVIREDGVIGRLERDGVIYDPSHWDSEGRKVFKTLPSYRFTPLLDIDNYIIGTWEHVTRRRKFYMFDSGNPLHETIMCRTYDKHRAPRRPGGSTSW